MLLPIGIITASLTLTLACSEDEGVGFEATMYLADVVVAGHVAENGGDAAGDVTFVVDCMYKNKPNSAPVDNSIKISGAYKTNTCETTYLEQGQDYVLALRGIGTDGKYTVFEYDDASSAAYPGDRIDFGTLVDLCGFENPVGLTAGTCQQRQTGVVCKTVSGGQTARAEGLLVGALVAMILLH